MPVTYPWVCGCSATGSGEKAAQVHSKTCPLMGWPFTNPDYPRPKGKP